MIAPGVPAQSPPSRYHYAIENLSTGDVRRVVSNRNGLPENSLILAPDTRYRAWLYEASTGNEGFVEFTTPSVGQRFTIPAIKLAPPRTPDFDRDGLSDDAEFTIGTDPRARDTDGDGLADGTEVEQGGDPTEGRLTRTGVIATVDTPGQAVDVFAFNDMAVVADSGEGISVFNVFNAMAPVIVARVDTPGTASRVAASPDFIAAAQGATGLSIIDFRDPAAAAVLHHVPPERLGGAATAIAVAGPTAYAGTSAGTVVAVDLLTGSVSEQARVGGRVYDLTASGDALFAIAGNTLHAFRLDPDFPEPLGTVSTSSFPPEGITGTRRVFVGGGIAYVTSYPGYDTIDVSNPGNLALLGRAVDSGPNSFKQIAVNGSGLGIAAVGANPRPDGSHHVSLYRVDDPGVTNAFEQTYETPGVAHAVSLYNGLAYVADGERGMQVVNYLAPDLTVPNPTPPTVRLLGSFPLDPPEAEEGKVVRVTAEVTADLSARLQVRNVEFWIEGVKAATDGNFPFEHRFTTPSRAEQPSFRLKARASDTLGNAVWSPEFVVVLVEDATPPRVRRLVPPDGSFRRDVTLAGAFFSEPVDPESFEESVTLLASGPDGRLGTGDDLAVVPGGFTFPENSAAALMVFAPGLPPGSYRGAIAAGVADLAGNRLEAPSRWRFTVYDVEGDSDGDCLPDGVETALGLDPAREDSDGDGLLDGEEDRDGDRLLNCGEVLLGTDPGRADTDGDLLPDGEELALGTGPLDPDTDEDGFLDGEEVEFGADPLDGGSTPAVEMPPLQVLSPAFAVLNAAAPPAGPVDLDVLAGVISVLNAAPPPAGSVDLDVLGGVLSVLNAAEPAAGPIDLDVLGAVLSVLNAAEPAVAPVAVDVLGPAVSVLSDVTPEADIVTGPTFSVENEAGP